MGVSKSKSFHTLLFAVVRVFFAATFNRMNFVPFEAHRGAMLNFICVYLIFIRIFFATLEKLFSHKSCMVRCLNKNYASKSVHFDFSRVLEVHVSHVL